MAGSSTCKRSLLAISPLAADKELMRDRFDNPTFVAGEIVLITRTYLLPRGRTAKALAAVAVAVLVAGCGSSGSSGSDPTAAAGAADATAQDTFNAQLADQHPGSKAAGANALVATTSTPATTVASTPPATTAAPTTVTTVKPVTRIHVSHHAGGRHGPCT